MQLTLGSIDWVSIGLKVLIAIVILLITWLLARIVRWLFAKLVGRIAFKAGQYARGYGHARGIRRSHWASIQGRGH